MALFSDLFLRTTSLTGISATEIPGRMSRAADEHAKLNEFYLSLVDSLSSVCELLSFCASIIAPLGRRT